MRSIKEELDSVFKNEIYSGEFTIASLLLQKHSNLKISEDFQKNHESRLKLASFIANMQQEDKFTCEEQTARFAGYLLETTDESGKPSLNALELLVDKGYNFYEPASHLLALNPELEITDNFPREARSLNHLWRFILDDDSALTDRLKKERSKLLSWQIESGDKPYNAFNEFLIQGERDDRIMLKILDHAPDLVLQARDSSDKRMILPGLEWVLSLPLVLSREKNYKEHLVREVIIECRKILKKSQLTSTYSHSEQMRGLILAIKKDKIIRLIEIKHRISGYSRETQAQKEWRKVGKDFGECYLGCFALMLPYDVVSILWGAAENSIMRYDYICYRSDGSHFLYNNSLDGYWRNYVYHPNIPATKPPCYTIHSFKDFFQGHNLFISIPVLLMLVLIVSAISSKLYIAYKVKKLDQTDKSEIKQSRSEQAQAEEEFVKQVKGIIVTPLYKARQRLALAFLGCQDKDQPPQRVTNDIFQLISKQLILNHQVYSPVPPNKINCFDADLTKKISAQFALKALSISP